MIIECPACRARFRLDEAKIKGKGARVRCRRCGESILVIKPVEPTAASAEAGAPEMLDLRSAVKGFPDEGPVSVPPARAVSTPPEPFPTAGFDPAAHVEEESPPEAATPGIWEPPVGPATAEPAAAAAIDEVDAAFEKFLAPGLPDKESLPEAEKTGFAPGEDLAVDFRPDEKMEFTPGEEHSTSDLLMSDKDYPGFSRDEEEQDKEPQIGQFDISTSLRQEPQDSPASAEIPAAPPSIDFLTQDMDPPPEKSPEESAPPSQPTADAPVVREPLHPRSPEPRAAAAPLLRPSLIALALLFVALAGGGAYLGFTENGQELLRKLVPGMESLWLQDKGKTGPQYDVRNLIGYYEPGAKAGNLFIIKGQVTNTGRSRKSGTRVHAALLDSKDVPVAEKTCYAGNVLAGETLRVASREKIEQALSNRFGDRLVNMDVAPGKSVPFMVVFFDAPEGIGAYRLEAKDGE